MSKVTFWGFLVCLGCVTVTCSPVKVPLTPPTPISTPTPTLFTVQSLGTSCEYLQDHEDGADLPDCDRIVTAIHGALIEFTALFPQASTFTLNPFYSPVHIHRKARQYAPSKPYPLIYSLDGVTLVRGYTVTPDVIPGYIGVDVYYSYEETLKHEFTHVLGYLYNGSTNRDPAAIVLPGNEGCYPDWQTFSRFPLYLVYSHGTTDDPFGTPGVCAGNSDPYPLPAWLGYTGN